MNSKNKPELKAERLLPRRWVYVVVAIELVALAVLYAMILTPVKKELHELNAELEKSRQELTFMRGQLNSQATKPKPTQSHSQRVGLVKFIFDTSRSFEIKVPNTGVREQSSTEAQVTLDGVPLNSLLAWLASMEKNGRVHVTQAKIDPSGPSGGVSALMLLSNADR